MAVASNWQMLMDRLIANRTRPDVAVAAQPSGGGGAGFAGINPPFVPDASPGSGEAGPPSEGGPGPISNLSEATAAFPTMSNEEATLAAINQNSFESNLMSAILGTFGMISPTPISLALGLAGQIGKSSFGNANQSLTESLVDMGMFSSMQNNTLGNPTPNVPNTGFQGEEEGTIASDPTGFGTIGLEGESPQGIGMGESTSAIGEAASSIGNEGLGIGNEGLGISGGPVGLGETGEGGGVGASGGPGTVICTELARQGYVAGWQLKREQAWARTVPTDVYIGYRLWADPIVRGMRRSRTITKVVAALAMPFINHVTRRPTLVGRLLLPLGMKLCGALGRRRRSHEDSLDFALRGWVVGSSRSSGRRS